MAGGERQIPQDGGEAGTEGPEAGLVLREGRGCPQLGASEVPAQPKGGVRGPRDAHYGLNSVPKRMCSRRNPQYLGIWPHLERGSLQMS